MPTLTVPKPITSNVPSITHTPYNPAQAAFNAFSGGYSAQGPQTINTPNPISVGTILSQFNPKSPKPVQSPLANTLYTPPNQTHVAQYLQTLLSGGSVNPTTGWQGSASQVLGKGGGSIQDYLAHKGSLDPVSAQAAIDQFKQGLSSGGITKNIGAGAPYLNAPAPPISSSTAAPSPSGPSQNSPFAPGQQMQMELGDALTKAAEAMLSGGPKPDSHTLGIIAQNMNQPGFEDAWKRAMGSVQTTQAMNAPKPPGAVSFINGKWVGPEAYQAPPPSAVQFSPTGTGLTPSQQAATANTKIYGLPPPLPKKT